MQFKDVIGHDHIKQQFKEMIAADRMPHAQLFIGPQGCGKLALAIAFAQYVLCEQKTADDACGSCAACTKVAKLAHPDLHFSYPTVGTNVISTSFLSEWRTAIDESPYLNVNQWLQSIGAENKQGNINKGECVSIIKRLSLKAFEGAYKILIMWLPEYLGKEGNRLLKLIEEPPERTLFVLVAENQHLILNTILSRCQIVKINQLNDEDITTALVERKGLDQSTAESIAHMASGDFNEALNLATNNENDNATLFLDWMRKCYKGNGVELVKWVDKFSKIGRENQKHFLAYALHFMREYMVLKMTGKSAIRLQDKELSTATNLTKVIEFEQIEQITSLFNDCTYYVERNANPKVLFLDASIQLNKILKQQIAVQ